MKKLNSLSVFYSRHINFLTQRRVRLALIGLVTLAVSLIFMDEASARAGGGGGYRSEGGGTSGGGGGDGDGIIILLFYLVRLAIHYPVIGIPAILIVLGFVIFGAYTSAGAAKSRHMTRTIRQGLERQSDSALSSAEDAIKARDPGFSSIGLAPRVREAFVKVQNAWAAQDMKPVRGLVSDGVYERFSIQLDIQKQCRVRNVMENLNVLNAQVIALKSDAYYDIAHLRVTARSSDYFIDTSNNRVVYGSKQQEQFTEYWSFLRRPGARTLTNPGLIEGFCPNCGSPLELADAVDCPSCGATVNSGEYDWVLAEITQEDEWQIRGSEDIPGFNAMVAKDPAFNIQHVEDRVSVMFYRHVASRFFADAKYVAKLADSQFLNANQNLYKAAPNGERDFVADAAIGSVDVIEIQTSDKPDRESEDLIRVKVKWAGHELTAKVPSLIIPDFDRNHIYSKEFILTRKSSVKTSAKNALTSAHCPNCGAPENLDNSGHCAYCDTPLNDGNADWNLREIRAFGGYQTLASIQNDSPDATAINTINFASGPQLSRHDNENLIGCAACVMLSEGGGETERGALKKLARAKGVSESRLNAIINTVRDGQFEFPHPGDKETAMEFIRCMAIMCLADGKVTATEKRLLNHLADNLGFQDIDTNRVIAEERQRLYRQTQNITNH